MSGDLNTLKAISFFSTTLHNKVSVEEVLWDITKNIIHKLDFCDCVIYIFDAERKLMVQSAAYGEKNPKGKTIYNRIEIPVGVGVVGHVAKTKAPIIIADTQKDSRYIVDDQERRSEISIPILINDQLFGVIDSEHPKPNFFDETHLHLLTIIAALCAQKIKDINSNKKNKLTTDNEYYKELIRLFEVDKIYRDPSLSLHSVSEKIGISAGYLSRLVNDTTCKSFSQFINEYRVDEVKRNLVSEEFSHYTILSIGLESGFNSKASFNRNFKEITGITPLEHLDSISI